MAIIPSDNNKSQFSKKKSEYNFVSPTGDGFQTRRIIRMEETRTITNTTLSHLLVEPCHKKKKRQGQHHLPTYMMKYHSYKTWECLVKVRTPSRVLYGCLKPLQYRPNLWHLCRGAIRVSMRSRLYAWLIGAITPRLEFLKLSVIYRSQRVFYVQSSLYIKMER